MANQSSNFSSDSVNNSASGSNSGRDSSTGNLFFDAWLAGSEQMIRAQSSWFTTATDVVESTDASAVVDKAKQHWNQCEQQFTHWLAASEQWLSDYSVAPQGEARDDDSKDPFLDSLAQFKKLLDPNTFLHSGVDELNQFCQRMTEGPDFADIGVLEKKWMRTSKDWFAWRDASANYQAVIATAWAKAFEIYTQDLAKLNAESTQEPSSQQAAHQPPHQQHQSLTMRELIQGWLRVANEQLIVIQRSDEFLEAQRNLFKTSTQYKLKQRELVETWCEHYTIPTRTEVDDLHRMVYDLRREVRELKQQLQPLPAEKTVSSQSKPAINMPKSVPAQQTADKASVKKPSPQKKTAEKDMAKKIVAQKVATKKVATKKLSTKQAVTKKTTPKKTVAQKNAAKKTVSRQVASKATTSKTNKRRGDV